MVTAIIVIAIAVGGPYNSKPFHVRNAVPQVTRTNIPGVVHVTAILEKRRCSDRYVRVYRHTRRWLRAHPRARYERVRVYCSVP
jgi:hypothetical protein